MMERPGQEHPLKDAIVATDPGTARPELERRLAADRQRLDALEGQDQPVERARLELDMGSTLFQLGRPEEAWSAGERAFQAFIAHQEWAGAVASCDLMYEADQPGSLAALGNGIWLGVTFPVPPQLSIDMLHHIVEETPAHSDGAAVAAVMAHYIADLRAEGQEREDLRLLTSQVVAQVAKRHRGMEDAEGVAIWIEVLQLNDVPELLNRLGKMLEVIVDGQWWVDRDELRSRLPEEQP